MLGCWNMVVGLEVDGMVVVVLRLDGIRPVALFAGEQQGKQGDEQLVHK